MSTYKLISWGANSHGQLGQGVLSEQSILPQEVNLSECGLKPETVKKIIGGGGHTLILDAEGCVYSCGRNDKGQVGISNLEQKNILTFQRLYFHGQRIVDACCGWDSSAALTENGDLYLWGSNRYGQLGDDLSSFPSTSSPVCTIRSRKIKRVSMGLRHTVVVTNNGEVLACGMNSKGQLGLVHPEAEKSRNVVCRFTAGIAFPTVLGPRNILRTISSNHGRTVPELAGIEDVACGEHHTVVATIEEDLYTTYFFGDNKHGQAALNPKTCPRICPAYRSVHHDLQLKAPIQIHAGWSHTNILNDGAVYSWGRNSYGQLGYENLEERQDSWRMQRVVNLPRVVQLSVGSEHNVALTEDGAIFCWGWNEHGNCGNGNTENVMIPQRLAIPHNSVAVLVGTGAGHSLAVIKDND